MVRAFKLYTGADNASHVLEGTIDEKDRTDVVAIHFKETPAHSAYDWHPDPEPQFVITLSGTLEFATPDGETFVVHPGDVLLAEDHIGKGHKWRLIDDQPWRRAYVVLKPGAKDSFVPKKGIIHGADDFQPRNERRSVPMSRLENRNRQPWPR